MSARVRPASYAQLRYRNDPWTHGIRWSERLPESPSLQRNPNFRHRHLGDWYVPSSRSGENRYSQGLWKGGAMRGMSTVGDCNEIEGVQVFGFSTEELLLKRWFMFIGDVDPDTMTSYNIGKIDLPFIYARAHRCQLDAASLISRFRGMSHLTSSSYYC